jgi:hypothetical protein
VRTRAAQATTIVLFALVIRTFLSIAAVVAVTISATVAGRPDEPPINQVVPPGRAVAGDRSA